ncbi:unnamed protein product [Nezara viridula]|uniref:Uncharacterized protein n=1 Tax=Nezara viridula TaxID=85310 RepID=A0A9P0E9U4_NEZVI|nr:unnamed protein product [Nezara viridula]
MKGKGNRYYPSYGVSSDCEEEVNAQVYQHTYQQPGVFSGTPTSDASDATLTDSELALARDSTLLVHNG